MENGIACIKNGGNTEENIFGNREIKLKDRREN